ncbi:hypothetical protein QA612_03075 [Evansella sp. AB-P1]|uniref:hypothetical protein n=1 Tax=Evansella sp. AB-P1 TaxID=3037653 RepID=UPI00241DBB81|nr:hypothetical protein [Evansella sp. AB-P1]MDG5786458.1 hypothetical protein [Evansella sp. AB-P1]
MQEQRKRPAFLQRVKKRFAGTEEVASVPAKSEKEVCRNRGSVQRYCFSTNCGNNNGFILPALLFFHHLREQ